MTEAISKDMVAIEKVVDLWDDKSIGKAEASIKREGSEEALNGQMKGIVNVLEGNIKGGLWIASIGAGGKGGDEEETSRIGISWDDSAVIVRI